MALESGILYGPLFSRRLGISLGVNVLPAGCKICNFDCIYCHYGLTDRTVIGQCVAFPSPDHVVQVVEHALRGTQRFDSLTFSGNGEPTLHPHFSDIIAEVRQLCDCLRPEVKLSLYSNATTLHQSRMHAVLRNFDNPILKLDVGDPQLFQAVNRPTGAFKLPDIPDITVIIEDLIDGVKHVPNLIIQSLLVDGLVNTSAAAAIQTWQAALAEIRPVRVQLYSCDYPVPVPGVTRVLPYVLKQIAHDTESRTGIQVDPFWIV